jgi:hypothetical protein
MIHAAVPDPSFADCFAMILAAAFFWTTIEHAVSS